MGFTAECEERKAITFITNSIGWKDNLIQQSNYYKGYVFRNCMGKNQDSGEYWATKQQSILNLLSLKIKLSQTG